MHFDFNDFSQIEELLRNFEFTVFLHIYVFIHSILIESKVWSKRRKMWNVKQKCWQKLLTFE